MLKKEDIVKYAISAIFSSIVATLGVINYIDGKLDTERKTTNASLSKVYSRYDILENNKLEKEVFSEFKTMYIRDQSDIKNMLRDLTKNTNSINLQVGRIEGSLSKRK